MFPLDPVFLCPVLAFLACNPDPYLRSPHSSLNVSCLIPTQKIKKKAPKPFPMDHLLCHKETLLLMKTRSVPSLNFCANLPRSALQPRLSRRCPQSDFVFRLARSFEYQCSCSSAHFAWALLCSVLQLGQAGRVLLRSAHRRIRSHKGARPLSIVAVFCQMMCSWCMLDNLILPPFSSFGAPGLHLSNLDT